MTRKSKVICISIIAVLLSVNVVAHVDEKSNDKFNFSTKHNKFLIDGPKGIPIDSNASYGSDGRFFPSDGEWNKTFDIGKGSKAYEVAKTRDGGYIIAGWTVSNESFYDALLIKTDENGNEEWNRTFGGKEEDIGLSVEQTSDGGYILAGYTKSYGTGSCDFWLMKTDENGNEEWNNTFGTDVSDFGESVKQTSDGGYIIAGWISYPGAKGSDDWVIKTDANGNEEWNKTFGGYGSDAWDCVEQTSEGGYILAGRTSSYGAGEWDFWLLKTDLNGNEEWNKTFGGRFCDDAHYIVQTKDGGYITTGSTESYGIGWSSVWLIKTDGNGNKEWDRIFGSSSGWDAGFCVQQTSDGGYIITGITDFPEFRNILLIKTDENGDKKWDRIFGGEGVDAAYSVVQADDGGYVIAGRKRGDAWLIKCFPPDIQVNIVKPKMRSLYIFDREIMPLDKPPSIILGPITIEADVSYSRVEVERVEFYIDGETQPSATLYEPPYSWKWDKWAFGWHIIKVVAYGSDQKDMEERWVWIFNI